MGVFFITTFIAIEVVLLVAILRMFATSGAATATFLRSNLTQNLWQLRNIRRNRPHRVMSSTPPSLRLQGVDVADECDDPAPHV
jgi:hypothetical protein